MSSRQFVHDAAPRQVTQASQQSIRFIDEREGRHDLFAGDMKAWRFYMCWLVSIGVAQRPEGGSFGFEASLTDEGRAVMRMLQSTRDPAWVELPMREVVEAVRTTGPGTADAAREQELRAFEAEAVHLPWIFVRRRLGASFMITLTGMSIEGRMPIRRVIWTQAFTDETMRDDFFAWLAERVERWEDWGKFAYSKGSDALTHRLLAQVGVSGKVIDIGLSTPRNASTAWCVGPPAAASIFTGCSRLPGPDPEAPSADPPPHDVMSDGSPTMASLTTALLSRTLSLMENPA